VTAHECHASPEARPEFLVDGCPRCQEYVDDLGVYFDPERFRAFWAKMIEVEFDDDGGYASVADGELGHRLYLVALQFQRAFGIDPHVFQVNAMTPRMIITLPDGPT
jgi:hypothetical protein